MAWVRTGSGATAVQIAESVAGRRRIVRHVGSARNEAELGLLIEEANRLLTVDRQGFLYLGIAPVAAKATMVGTISLTVFPAVSFSLDPPMVGGLKLCGSSGVG